MNNKVYSIEEIKEIVSGIAKQYGVERITLFGSYARGEAKPESDIDLLIDKGQIKGLFKLSGFRLDIEDKLGKNVDLVIADDTLENKRFLQRIRENEILIYQHHKM